MKLYRTKKALLAALLEEIDRKALKLIHQAKAEAAVTVKAIPIKELKEGAWGDDAVEWEAVQLLELRCEW